MPFFRSFFQSYIGAPRPEFFLLCLFLTFVGFVPASGQSRAVRVGVFPAAPLVLIDRGKPSGLFIDILEYCAARKGWKLDYVEGTWNDLLGELERGELDLLPAVSHTAARTSIYDFSRIPLFIDSGVLFTRPGWVVHTIFELEGKRVAAVKGSIFTEGFIEYVASFGVRCEILDKADNPAVMAAIEAGEADAGVCIYSLGLKLAETHKVAITPISFSPLALEFAVPRGKNADILEGIDGLMAGMVNDSNSLYSRSFQKWNAFTPVKEIPGWIYWGAGGLLALGLALALWNWSLKAQVQKQTFQIKREASERMAAEEGKRRVLAERETLLHELYHRTRNTMQTVQGLIVLQSEELPDIPELTLLVKSVESRIQTISLVHQMLYESSDLTRIPVAGYVHGLLGILRGVYRVSEERIAITVDIPELRFMIDTAVPFGLLLNELLTNAFIHGFPGERSGHIAISMQEVAAGRCRVTVRDDGVGVSPGFDFQAQATLGLKLIYGLGEQQLGGAVRFSADGGLCCEVEFPEELYAERV